MNMWAVFVHYLGDAISSLFVLATGLLVWFFPTKKWTLYLDPASSIIIVGIMLYTTIPLVRQCAHILLHRVPAHVNLAKLRAKLLQIENVNGIHDLHVWCLVDGMTISTVHIAISSPEHFDHVCKQARKVFHKQNIHSSTIQPEYPKIAQPKGSSAELSVLASRSAALTGCEQNCLPNCNEDWCCKGSTPPQSRTPINHGALDYDPFFNPREEQPPRLSPPPQDHQSGPNLV
jgi:zinc transporter 1